MPLPGGVLITIITRVDIKFTTVIALQEGWEGDLSSSMCRWVDCGLQLSGDKLLRGCVPVHTQNVCCPTDWVCPQQTMQSPINPRSDANKKGQNKLVMIMLLPTTITIYHYYYHYHYHYHYTWH